MLIYICVIKILLVVCCFAEKQARRFPDDFRFGTATAAYQIEGAWNEDGKGESIWDHWTHSNKSMVLDHSNGDIAADSYHNYKRDVEMIRELGLNIYRFSISWSRVLPTGFSNEINEAGVAFYNNYINEMLKYNITPMVTLYHWDLPQKLQEFGGFMNPLIEDWFEDYARVAYERFGDRVKHWITINEPKEVCYDGYGAAVKAPLLNDTAIGTYVCAKNILMAHARAYHLYNDVFKPIQKGQCGITISVSWFAPLTDSEKDKFAAEVKRQVEWGMYAEPIFSEKGGFPSELSQLIAKKSIQQRFSHSRLPEFTEDEKAYVRGSSDFFGVNHYTGALISATKHLSEHPVPSLYDDAGIGTYFPEEWAHSAADWLYLAPNSVFSAFTHLKQKYNDPIFYLTENGWSLTSSNPIEKNIIDDERIYYYRTTLENVLDALDAGVRLKGYMAWSLMDNFEWNSGYTEHFGLYRVDFKDPARKRTPRKSAFVYKQIVKTRQIDHDYEPESMVMTIDEGH